MKTPSEDSKAVARHLVAALGGSRPRINAYWDDARRSSVAIAQFDEVPEAGLRTIATVGLSDTAMTRDDGSEFPLRVELLGGCRSEAADEGFANVVATAAFFVINSGFRVVPGAVLPDVFDSYPGLSKTLRHLLFVPPFVWEDTLETLKLGSKTVAFLLAVPISDAERALAEAQGSEALEDLFEAHEVNIFDLNRPSVA